MTREEIFDLTTQRYAPVATTLIRGGQFVRVVLDSPTHGVDEQGRHYDRNMPYFWQERGTDQIWQVEADLRKR